jgi:hypothetical protein
MGFTHPLSTRIRNSAAIFFLLVLSCAFCFPLLKDLYLACGGDWDFFYCLYEIPSISLFEYRQFPLWNPYCGGGMPMFANPQAGFPSPTFLATSLFGVVAGLKISVWLHTFLGLWGMWLLSGEMGIKGPARLAPPLIFIFSSSWALHLAVGHVVWLPAALLPFFFLAFLKSFEKARWLLAAALFESLMFYEGGTYVLGFSVVFVGIYALCHSLHTRSWRPAAAFLAVNVLAAALSAPKLLPVLELLQSHPRPTDAGGSLRWDDYLSIFIERNGSLGSNWWEFGAYLGLVVVVIYLCSLSLFRKYPALILASLFMLLVALGNFAHVSPWGILHKLPLYSGFQVPTRALIVFGFSAALLTGLYLGRPGTAPPRSVTIAVALIVLIIGIDLYSLSARILPEALKPVKLPPTAWIFSSTPEKPVFPRLSNVSPDATTGFRRSVASVHEPFSQISIPGLQKFVHGAYSAQYPPLLHNKGVVDAYETIPIERHARAVNDKDYRGEFYLLDDGAAVLLSWSPNRFVYHVSLQNKNRLVINQNYWPGWHSSRGVLTRHEGLLAIDLPPGDYDVAVHYLPRSFLIGTALFLAALAMIITALCTLGKKRRLPSGTMGYISR